MAKRFERVMTIDGGEPVLNTYLKDGWRLITSTAAVLIKERDTRGNPSGEPIILTLYVIGKPTEGRDINAPGDQKYNFIEKTMSIQQANALLKEGRDLVDVMFVSMVTKRHPSGNPSEERTVPIYVLGDPTVPEVTVTPLAAPDTELEESTPDTVTVVKQVGRPKKQIVQV